MKIAGYEKLSLQDFPNQISCIIFTQGCNIRCPFCQNSTLIPMDSNNLISEKEIFNYLNLRKNIISGVTISGGEPTLQLDLESFIDILLPKLQMTENNELKEKLLKCLEHVTKYNEYYGEMYKVEEITELMEDFESAENQSEEVRNVSKQIVINITDRQGKNKKGGYE